MIKVAVFPNGEHYEIDDIPTNMSDDYEVRMMGHCDVCDEDIVPSWGEPIAGCACHDQEWHQ